MAAWDESDFVRGYRAGTEAMARDVRGALSYLRDNGYAEAADHLDALVDSRTQAERWSTTPLPTTGGCGEQEERPPTTTTSAARPARLGC